MEGGIGILLLVIIAVVAIGFAIALYLTGGALWSKQTSPRTDDSDDGSRPEHKRPTSLAQERTHFVGTGRDKDD
jgi:hypothetical protein